MIQAASLPAKTSWPYMRVDRAGVMLAGMVAVAVAEKPEVTLSCNFEHFKAKNSSSRLL